MTTYLKRGDRIFFVYPGHPNPRVEQENAAAIKKVFANAGVEVFGSMSISSTATFEIVAVLRDE